MPACAAVTCSHPFERSLFQVLVCESQCDAHTSVFIMAPDIKASENLSLELDRMAYCAQIEAS